MGTAQRGVCSSVKVSFEYTPDKGEDMSTITVWHMDDKRMEMTKFPASFDEGTNTITFETGHFSYWLIGHDTAEDTGNDMPVAIVVILIAILCLCGGLLRMKR